MVDYGHVGYRPASQYAQVLGRTAQEEEVQSWRASKASAARARQLRRILCAVAASTTLALHYSWMEWGQYHFCVCPSPIANSLWSVAPNEVQFTVMLTLNDGYVDFFYAWYEQYKKLGLPYEVLVVAEDDNAFRNLRHQYPPGSAVPPVQIERGHINSSSEAAVFGSYAYKQMMAARATHMLRHMTVGKNLLFTDVDAFWVSNPLVHFAREYDMWMPVEKPAVWPFRTHTYHNAGFMGVRSNGRTIGLVKAWEAELLRLGATRNQRVLHVVLIQHSGEPEAVRLQSLSHLNFPSGYTYFVRGCKHDAVVVHANSGFHGHQQKIDALRGEGLWVDPPKNAIRTPMQQRD